MTLAAAQPSRRSQLRPVSRLQGSSRMHQSSSAISVRSFASEDLLGALAVQTSAHPASLIEDADAFASRIRLAASYCLIAERDGMLVAYLLAHGWRRRSPPSLGSVVADVTNEVLFVHDLAVSPAGRGVGVGRTLIKRAFALAARNGLRDAELIAVGTAAGYWRWLGFTEAAVSAELAVEIAAYGPETCFMQRAIPQSDDDLAYDGLGQRDRHSGVVA